MPLSDFESAVADIEASVTQVDRRFSEAYHGD